MESSQAKSKWETGIAEMIQFIPKTSGLKFALEESSLKITQMVDGKHIEFLLTQVEEVLRRNDLEGNVFLQINFTLNKKVLLTDSLIGFKPKEIPSLDLTKIPRVVTTPDLLSVFEAIEESINSEISNEAEVEVLKKVYSAILLGGEDVGIDMRREKLWLDRLTASKIKATA